MSDSSLKVREASFKAGFKSPEQQGSACVPQQPISSCPWARNRTPVTQVELLARYEWILRGWKRKFPWVNKGTPKDVCANFQNGKSTFLDIVLGPESETQVQPECMVCLFGQHTSMGEFKSLPLPKWMWCCSCNVLQNPWPSRVKPIQIALSPCLLRMIKLETCALWPSFM